VDAVVTAGIAKVVAALEDPDPRVSGMGVERLRAAGIEVELGDGMEEAQRLNRRWLAVKRVGRPFVALKFAMTLDGKIATAGRQSRWITGEAARAEAHRLRQAYDAIAVGVNTVLEDDPLLTAREPDGSLAPRQPLRVVVDGRLRIKPGARVLDAVLPGRTVVATTAEAFRERGQPLLDDGVWVEKFDAVDTIAIEALLGFVGAQGATSLLIEGGGELAWSAVAAGMVDYVYAFVAPVLVGGATAPTPVAGPGFGELEEALRLKFANLMRFDDDILVEARPA
jgi:diaminohydroxyphosphoribosylaminopyrimidine deaminase/5-amino-6-(5-phosphoribosylamino)uracil reductase